MHHSISARIRAGLERLRTHRPSADGNRSTLQLEVLEPRLPLAATPQMVDINPAGVSSPTGLTVFGDHVYFAANDGATGNELWRTDGTADGTELVRDIRGGEESSDPSGLTVVGDSLYFTANDGTGGVELWKTDGTAAGTALVRDIAPGSSTVDGETTPSSSSPYQLTNVNGTLFFNANDGTNGRELWKSDGTEGGTELVLDINPGELLDTGTPNSSNPGSLVNVDGTLFFSADDGTNGRELWKSDGSTGGTLLVKDIHTGTGPYYYNGNLLGEYPNSSFPGLMVNVGGELFFAANDGQVGAELWKSDGTAEGTVLVKDIQTGEGNAFTNTDLAEVVDGVMYFTVNDGTHGNELWMSDGTESGTQLVLDINPGAEGDLSYFPGFVEYQGELYFSANDGTTGRELWKTDGTASGTLQVSDIAAGTYDDNSPLSSFPFYMANVNGTLYFSGFTRDFGRELWKTDGTPAGTELVANIRSGGTGVYPNALTDLNGTLVFSGGQDNVGRELYLLNTDPSFRLTISVDGQQTAIPTNLGRGSDGTTSTVYTVDSSSEIYYDATSPITLSDFFNTWQNDAREAGNRADAQLTSTSLFSNQVDGDNWLQMFVNGELNSDFENYTIQDDDQIVLVYGSNPVVSLITNFGPVIIELFDEETPITTENFLTYVNDGDYLSSFFHRADDDFVIQGGGFRTSSNTFENSLQFSNVTSNGNIQNEPGISNTRGTVAMAKQAGDPNSANSQFFVNLSDTNAFLDLPQNDSFTAFGQVLDMETADLVSRLPINSELAAPFSELPLGAQRELVVVESIVGLGIVQGTLFADENGSGTQDSGEAGIAGQTIFHDANGNGQLDSGEDATQTDADGNYALAIPPGDVTLRVANPPGLVVTDQQGDTYSATVTLGRNESGANFGLLDLTAPTVPDLLAASDTGANSSDNVTSFNNGDTGTQLQFRVDNVEVGAEVQLFIGGTLAGSAIATTTEVVVTTTATASPADGILVDGDYTVTARQTVGQLQSEASASLLVTIDTTPPGDFTSAAPTEAVLDTLLSYDANSADEGAAGITYSLVSPPNGMSIDSTTGIVDWTPTSTQVEPTDFSIVVSDLAGNSTTQQVSLNVLGVIAARPDIFNGTEDTPFDFDIEALVGNDGNPGDPDTLQLFGFGELPQHGSFSSLEDGAIVYTPDPDFNGVDSFTYRVTDGIDASNFTRVTINVTAVQDAPRPVDDSYSVVEDGSLVIAVATGLLANDVEVDGETLSATRLTDPANGTLTLQPDGSFTYTPSPNFFGDDSFTYSVSDGTESSGPVTVNLIVTAVNDAPQTVTSSYTVEEDGTLDVTIANGVLVGAMDVENDVLTASVASQPQSGTLNFNEDGSFIYTPNADFFGTDQFTFTASDGMDLSEETTVTIEVTATADPPQAVNDTAEAFNNGVAIQIGVLANDSFLPDADQSLTVTATTGGADGSVISIGTDGATINYTAPIGFIGEDTFQYTLTDSDNLTDTATVTVTVTEAGKNVVTGVVYHDANENGARDEGEAAIPGVRVTLSGTDNTGTEVTLSQLTANDGSYRFEEVVSGTYALTQGDTAGMSKGGSSSPTNGAVTADGSITALALTGSQTFVDNNFASTVIGSEYMSIAWFFTSNFGSDSFFRNLVAQAEEAAGNSDLADEIRATTAATNLTSAGSATVFEEPTSSNVEFVPTSAPSVDGNPDFYDVTPGSFLGVGPDRGVLQNDGNGSQDLQAVVAEAPQHGSLILNRDGGFFYTPEADFRGTDRFAYYALDDQVRSDPIEVSLAVESAEAGWAESVDEAFGQIS